MAGKRGFRQERSFASAQDDRALAQDDRLCDGMAGKREVGQEKSFASAQDDRAHQTQIMRSRMFQKTKEEWLDAAEAFYRHEHYEQALAAYDQALRLGPTNPSFHHRRSRALSSLADYPAPLA